MATPIDNDQIRIMWPYISANLADENVRAILPEKLVHDPERMPRAFDKLEEWEMAQTSPRCVNIGDCHQGNHYGMPNGRGYCMESVCTLWYNSVVTITFKNTV